MFIPLYDTGFADRRAPWLSIALVIINILAFIVVAREFYSIFGLIPAQILANQRLYTLITSLFLHISIWHLFSNMWFLWLFGDNVEHALGKIKFLLFYLFCGAVAGIGYAFIATNKSIPLIGASGAISGILGAYLVLYPKNRIETFVFLPPFLARRVEIPCFWFLIFWFVLQLTLSYLSHSALTAYSAHIIGFLTGILFVRFFKA